MVGFSPGEKRTKIPIPRTREDSPRRNQTSRVYKRAVVYAFSGWPALDI
jgi:hypothetical protein